MPPMRRNNHLRIAVPSFTNNGCHAGGSLSGKVVFGTARRTRTGVRLLNRLETIAATRTGKGHRLNFISVGFLFRLFPFSIGLPFPIFGKLVLAFPGGAYQDQMFFPFGIGQSFPQKVTYGQEKSLPGIRLHAVRVINPDSHTILLVQYVLKMCPDKKMGNAFSRPYLARVTSQEGRSVGEELCST